MNKETCSNCGGKGWIGHMEDVCPVCKGTGKVIKQSGPVRGSR
jgi:RecJ-like exonuclease